MDPLSPTHGANIIKGCNAPMRDALIAADRCGTTRFADLSDIKAGQLGTMCMHISKEVEQLKTQLNVALEDGVVTPEERDGLVTSFNHIASEVEEGRAL